MGKRGMGVFEHLWGLRLTWRMSRRGLDIPALGTASNRAAPSAWFAGVDARRANPGSAVQGRRRPCGRTPGVPRREGDEPSPRGREPVAHPPRLPAPFFFCHHRQTSKLRRAGAEQGETEGLNRASPGAAGWSLAQVGFAADGVAGASGMRAPLSPTLSPLVPRGEREKRCGGRRYPGRRSFLACPGLLSGHPSGISFLVRCAQSRPTGLRKPGRRHEIVSRVSDKVGITLLLAERARRRG